MRNEELIAYIHSVEIMTRLAYWCNATSKHCGADMHDECVDCGHYNFCREQGRADTLYRLVTLIDTKETKDREVKR